MPDHTSPGGLAMSVKQILANKGHHVEMIGPDERLGAAVLRLASKRIGAVLVCNPDRTIVGILSERDIVRALVGGGAVLDEPVSAYMTRDVVTSTATASIADIMEIMTQGRFRHLPVTDNNELVGLVSIGDVVKYRVAEIESEKSAIIAYIAAG
jgi:CBS domain-containing protein